MSNIQHGISNRPVCVYLSACTHRQTHRQMKGRKDEFIQQSEKINSILKETDELSPILFKSIDGSKRGKCDNFLGYWTFRNTIRHILVFLHVYLKEYWACFKSS
jgi:hypothetical protein